MGAADVVLTGPPRSGTTLVCFLLNKLPNVVALHEPMNVGVLTKPEGKESVCDMVESFYRDMRGSILTRRVAISKQVSGEIPDNHMSNSPGLSGLREDQATLGEISITKHLSRDFILVIKHPAVFTAGLAGLVKHFRCYALVRNPLAVLASWNSIAMPQEQGRAPVAESLDAELKTHLARTTDKIERQLYLLSWYFDRYRRILPRDSILRYEDVVSSEGRVLEVIVPWARHLNERLENRNQNSAYAQDLIAQAGEKLLASNGPYWEFYSRDDVTALVN